MPIHVLLETLSGRLPELSWKLHGLGSTLNPALFPKGLFRDQIEMTPDACIDEIKADLFAIKNQVNQQAAQFLVQRVEKKINVLVNLCKVKSSDKAIAREEPFGVQAITTRQKWLQTMHDDIEKLSAQQKALMNALVIAQKTNNTDVLLNLQSELGEAERRLTLAQETLTRRTAL